MTKFIYIFLSLQIFLSCQIARSQSLWEEFPCPSTFGYTIETVIITDEHKIIIDSDNPPRRSRVFFLQTWWDYTIGFEDYSSDAIFRIYDYVFDSLNNIVISTAHGVWRSTDHGLHWERRDTLSNFSDVVGIEINSLGHMFVLLWSGEIARSVDDGATWEIVRDDLIFPNKAISIAIDHNDRIFVGTDYGQSRLFRSSDNGDSWEEIGEGVFGQSAMSSIFVNAQNDIFICSQYYMAGIYRSLDGGDSWQEVNNGLPYNSEYDYYQNQKDMVFNSEGSIFVSVFQGIYRSDDNGETWTNFSEGLFYSNYPTLSMTIDSSDYLYIIRQNTRLYKTVLPTTEISTSLAQVEMPHIDIYPNPVSDLLYIDLGTAGTKYKVIIRNIIGDIIHEERFDRNGIYWFQFPEKAGMYIVEVNVDDFTYFEKVIKM